MEILKNAESRYLRYDFTASETHDLSMALANKTQAMASKRAEKKAISSQLKSELDAIESDVAQLSNKVANGYEMRSVECEIIWHKPEQGKKTIIRKDTNEKTVEKMTSEEWTLFNQEKEDDAA